MESPEDGRSVKQKVEDNSDINSDRSKDEEGWESDDKRKHRSSKSRKSGNREEDAALDNSGLGRSAGERSESRKRSSSSSRLGSDEDDYDMRKESHSKLMKRKQEESSLEKLSNWYQEGELENKHDGGDKTGVRAHGRADEIETRKSASSILDHERSRSRSKIKNEISYDGDLEKSSDRDSRNNERRESSRGKEHGSAEHARSSKRRWDETDAVRKGEDHIHAEKSDTRSGKAGDAKHEIAREKGVSSRSEPSESKSRGLDSNNEKGMQSYAREDKRADSDRSKSKGRSEAPDEDTKRSSSSRENKTGKDRTENLRQQENPTSRNVAESHANSLNTDEDGNTGPRDKGKGEAECSDRATTPERSGRQHHESESEVDNKRSSFNKRKELEKDGHRDERTKDRDDGFVEKDRDWEGYKDMWKRGQPSSNDETKNGETAYSHGRDWELQRPGRDRIDNERSLGRFGNRKDGNRSTDAVKTSSSYGISNENYDVIEIQTKPFPYEKGEPGSTYSRRNEASPQSDVKLARNDDEWAYPRDDRSRKTDVYGSGPSGDDSNDRFVDYGAANQDQNSWRDDNDTQAGKGRDQKGVLPNRSVATRSSSGGSQPPFGNMEPGSFSRAPLGGKMNRVGRGVGRSKPPGRDSQQPGIPVPMMGSPFGPIGMPPPGPMQPLTPSMPPTPGPPMSPGVFIPPFAPSIVWPGARGVDMNMLAAPPSLTPIPPGPSGPRFSSSFGNPPYFNQSSHGRGMPPNLSGPGFNAMIPMGRGQPQEKMAGGWVPPKTNGPAGKAPSRGEQNDYSQNFVDTGMRPQNFIRELELTNVVEDYPKLRELIQKKDEIVSKSASPPMYYKCDLKEHALSPEFFGTKFDVILVDPPWEEYVHRAPGVTDHMDYWNFEEIMNLKIEAIADTPSFIFLWVGDAVGLEQGRQCLKKWGFRRCEDICWVKTNKANATPSLRHDSHTLFQHTKEHCLMGIKGTVRRSTDGHIIHANIDTDVIIAEEPPYGSTAKPEDMYRIIEHFSLGRRRLELFGEDHNIRSGWLTVGKGLSSSNFNAEGYVRNFSDKDGKVWQGGGGRNPPPEAPHLVVTTPDIESLRPKSPMKNQQQMQMQMQMQMQQSQSASIIALTTANSSNNNNKRAPPPLLPTGNSNPLLLGLNQEASISNSNPSSTPWAASPMEFRGGGQEGGGGGGNIMAGSSDDNRAAFEIYGGGFNNNNNNMSSYGQQQQQQQANVEYLDFESQRAAMNLL